MTPGRLSPFGPAEPARGLASRSVRRPPPEDLPPWTGAPGYQPDADELPPHAPMPGAPPYPDEPQPQQEPELEPPPVRRPGYWTAVAATAVWAVVAAVLQLAISGPPPSLRALGILLGSLVVHTLLGAVAVWLFSRRSRWPFWQLVVLAMPIFWILRIVLVVLVAG